MPNDADETRSLPIAPNPALLPTLSTEELLARTRTQLRIVNALSKNFLNVFLADLGTETITVLQEIKQIVIPSNVQVNNDTLISIRSLFGNEQIAEEYLIQNVGLYATDGENDTAALSLCR